MCVRHLCILQVLFLSAENVQNPFVVDIVPCVLSFTSFACPFIVPLSQYLIKRTHAKASVSSKHTTLSKQNKASAKCRLRLNCCFTLLLFVFFLTFPNFFMHAFFYVRKIRLAVVAAAVFQENQAQKKEPISYFVVWISLWRLVAVLWMHASDRARETSRRGREKKHCVINKSAPSKRNAFIDKYLYTTT